MNESALASIKSDMTLSAVKNVLQIIENPHDEVIGSKSFRLLRLDKFGVQVFFGDKDVVSSVRFEAPFSGSINNVKIGYSIEEVEKSFGKPQRRWPVQDGTDRWLYNTPDFMRIDFDPQTNLVKYVFR